MNESVFRLDQQQSDPERARACPKAPKAHGAMGVHASGMFYICGCGYKEPASQILGEPKAS